MRTGKKRGLKKVAQKVAQKDELKDELKDEPKAELKGGLKDTLQDTLKDTLRSMGEYEEIKDLLNFHQFNENSFFGNKLCIDCKFRFSVRKLGSTLYFDERFPFCEKFYHGKPPEIIFHEEGYKCKFFMPESEKDKQE